VVPLLLGFPQNKGSVFLGRVPETSAKMEDEKEGAAR